MTANGEYTFMFPKEWLTKAKKKQLEVIENEILDWDADSSTALELATRILASLESKK
jgi:hypothetical protein